MCLIATAPKRSLISMHSLENAYLNNKDGWGIVFQDKQRKELIVRKELTDFEAFTKAWEEVPDDVTVAVHFRWKTHGTISVDNIHPYIILDKNKGHPIDLVLMHNGVLHGIHKGNNEKSDTLLYVETVLQPLCQQAPYLYRLPAFHNLVQSDIGKNNKFVLMSSDGDVVILNKEQGHEEKEQPDVWYSNYYSIKDSTYRTKPKNQEITKFNPFGWWLQDDYTPSYRQVRQQHYQQHQTKQESSEPIQGKQKELFRKEDENLIKEFKFPEDLTDQELKIKMKIMDLIPKGHELIDKIESKGKTHLGFGWLRKVSLINPSDDILIWNNKIGKLQKQLCNSYKNRKENSKIVSIDKETAKRLTESNLKIMTLQETMEWVVDHTDDAVDYLLRNGMSGGRNSVLNWLNNNLEKATDMIYNLSRYGSTDGPRQVAN